MFANMRAVPLLRRRIAFSETAFAELVLWQLPKPVAGSTHQFKYRLADACQAMTNGYREVLHRAITRVTGV